MPAAKPAVISEESVPELAAPLGPDSLWWRIGLPRTILLFAGRALLMQVCHPVIGAGVRDFSTFRSDPWTRLDHTTSSLALQIFGGERAVAESHRLRDLHTSIKGTGFHGERYSARDPKAYAWVHLSNFDSVLSWLALVGPAKVQPHHHEELYAEWRQAGLVLGIKDQHMPRTLAGFHDYVDDVIATQLEATPTALELIHTLTLRPVPPPPLLPRPIWGALKPVGRTVLHDFTVGTLPVELRDTLGFTWSPKQERRLQRSAVAVRLVAPRVPGPIVQYPLGWQALRASREYRRHGGPA